MREKKENVVIEEKKNVQLKKFHAIPEIEKTDLNHSFDYSKNFKKIASALFYGLASIMIMFSNKIVLTKYRYLNFRNSFLILNKNKFSEAFLRFKLWHWDK